MIRYIDYLALKEFYTIEETCQLLELDKQALRIKSEQYGILPVRNENNQYGFVKYDFRTLHNKLYYEDRIEQTAEDPWA